MVSQLSYIPGLSVTLVARARLGSLLSDSMFRLRQDIESSDSEDEDEAQTPLQDIDPPNIGASQEQD